MKSSLGCEKCGKDIPNRPDRKTKLCRDCILSTRRCPKCGQLTDENGSHPCANVDLKGDRFCLKCGKKLINSGYQRWWNICPQCSKKQWRGKEKILRNELKRQFGGACLICGFHSYYPALHFHHIDPKTKWGKGKLQLLEVKRHPERFQLLCANCHIKVTLAQEIKKMTLNEMAEVLSTAPDWKSGPAEKKE